MLKIWRMWGIALLSVVMGIGAVQAQTQSEDEAAKAKALLTDAVNYYKENGDKALAVFSRQGPFVRDDLYVFAINTNGIMLASGGPSVMLIGRDIMNSIDDELKPKFQQALSMPPGDEILEADYPWGSWDTGGRKITKHVYYQRVGDTVLAVGYYRPRATSEEALQLLNSAVEAVGADARETFKAINALDERFYKDDLYVFVVEMDSQRIVAHGSNLRLVGRDLSALANRVGRPINAEDLTRVNAEGAIEFAYQWEHPITGEVETKHAFARRVGSYLVAVGYYKPEGEQAE
ncbi:Single Cache domain 2-containing protein [Halopseudomonas formosensis]|uniref:Single Cache domain 2-containing protein n=1 Tax=Halopseudomonas formosensis TaxID=1002526 RepID=A0A1I5ZVS7_9GAMM|nr:cache domain-containing protein [Halopseudomonas formosensis]SFQ60500.1 Single Cache domain 2-containing protein [Halopseudomonas formosensis]